MAEGPKRGPQGAHIEAPVGDGAEVSRLNLIELVPALQMPVLLFLGVVRITGFRQRPEHFAHFEALRAPSKKLVWFEHSGREPFVDEPDKFNVARAELVRPALLADLPARAA